MYFILFFLRRYAKSHVICNLRRIQELIRDLFAEAAGLTWYFMSDQFKQQQQQQQTSSLKHHISPERSESQIQTYLMNHPFIEQHLWVSGGGASGPHRYC